MARHTLTFASLGLLLLACSSSSGAGSAEANLTPAYPQTIDEQRLLCVDRVKENGAFRYRDLDNGVVRWKCGDVVGVNGADLGQEYCEFHAYQDGDLADKMAPSHVRANKIECLFTGVFKDHVWNDEAATKAYGDKLTAQIHDAPGNLTNAVGKRTAQTLMSGPFNSRDAATKLISDCAGLTHFIAPAIDAASDTEQCSADGAGCFTQKDVEACTAVIGAGAGWRNSDPIICGRSVRGTVCGDTFGAMPDSLDGFFMTDWEADVGSAVKWFTGQATEPPTLPERCRYAKIDGKPYLHMLICRPTTQDVNRYKNGAGLQQMCGDVFGPKISMSAPIGLITQPGAAESDAFCKEFNDGARNIQHLAGLPGPLMFPPHPEPEQPNNGGQTPPNDGSQTPPPANDPPPAAPTNNADGGAQ